MDNAKDFDELFFKGDGLKETGQRLVDLIDQFRNLKVIAWTTLIFGILLYFSDKFELKNKISSELNIKSIIIIGLFQILAIIPGVSRSGIVITASRFLKFDRLDSSKIAFYLSIPALTGASFLGIKDVLNTSINFNFIFLYGFFAFLIVYASQCIYQLDASERGSYIEIWKVL